MPVEPTCTYCDGRGIYEGKDVATGQCVELACLYCDETGIAPTDQDKRGYDALIEKVARAICGRDLEWRDCERACLSAGKCVGKLSRGMLDDARAAIDAYESTLLKERDALRSEVERLTPRYAQPCFDHEYITPGCPDCGKLA
jgi:hypothetical protein